MALDFKWWVGGVWSWEGGWCVALGPPSLTFAMELQQCLHFGLDPLSVVPSVAAVGEEPWQHGEVVQHLATHDDPLEAWLQGLLDGRICCDHL